MKIKGIIFCFIIILQGGCCIIPTPELAYEGGSIITKKALNSLEPDKSTREDVLLLLGNPLHRWDNDRIFIYDWSAGRAYVIVFFGYFGAGEVYTNNIVAIEFKPNNYIKSIEQKTHLFK